MFLKAREIISNNKIGRKRGFIAEDETIVFNLTRKAYLWAAREVEIGGVIVIHISRGGVGECLTFLEEVREACINNLTIYTDKEPWYIWLMKFLKIKHRKKTFGMRNSIES